LDAGKKGNRLLLELGGGDMITTIIKFQTGEGKQKKKRKKRGEGEAYIPALGKRRPTRY